MPKRMHDPHGVRVAPPTGVHVVPFTAVNCPRCAKPCWIRQTSVPPDSPFVALVPAITANGLCEECAAHWWLFTVDGLRWAFQDGPGVLCQANVQAVLTSVLTKVAPALGQLDWTRLLAQWDLPWPDDWTLPKDG